MQLNGQWIGVSKSKQELMPSSLAGRLCRGVSGLATTKVKQDIRLDGSSKIFLSYVVNLSTDNSDGLLE